MNGKQKEGGVVSFFENTRKPVGLGGKIMVVMMNFGHSAMAEWGLHFLQYAPDAMVLDCGCGGGANIKKLLQLCPKGKVQGIDYSAVSVEKARKVNAGAIAEGRCTVQQASVAAVSYTHLDVYKRQSVSSGERTRKRANREEKSFRGTDCF